MKNKKETTSPICIRIPDTWINLLQNKAREKAFKDGEDVNFHDLIRKAIYDKFIGETK